ncbi:MAG: NUDIX domain-containing protein [Hyphomicrobiales bacterium]
MTDPIEIEKAEVLSQRWARLTQYTIRYRRRDGSSETLLREVHDHGHGAAVLPYDLSRGTVLLVRQFRLPAYLNGGDGMLIEACAGLLDGGDAETCARREAEEELGYRVDNLRQVASTFMSPGAITERLTMFLAGYGESSRINAGGGHIHEGEDIEVLEMPLAEAWRMVVDGRIADAKTVMLLQFLKLELLTPSGAAG